MAVSVTSTPNKASITDLSADIFIFCSYQLFELAYHSTGLRLGHIVAKLTPAPLLLAAPIRCALRNSASDRTRARGGRWARRRRRLRGRGSGRSPAPHAALRPRPRRGRGSAPSPA